MPPRPGPARDPRGGVRVSRADILTVTRNVRRVYENAHLLADEGLVDFDAFDLRPALAILREHLEERPR